MPIFQILTANNAELDLFTGANSNDVVPLDLLEDDGASPLDLTGMTLKAQLLSAEYASFEDFLSTEIIFDAKDVDVIGDPTLGNVELDLTATTIADSKVQPNAVLLIYDTAASDKPVALGFCNVRPGKRAAP